MSVDFEITQLADSIRSAPRSKFTDPYPAPIVHRTIALAKRLCPSTYSYNHLANLLGLSPKTITNWLATKSPAPVMVPVLVSPPSVSAVVSINESPSFSLNEPATTEIYTLSLEQLASLLKAMS